MKHNSGQPIPSHYRITRLQRKGIRKIETLTGQIRLANENYDTMRRAGLENEAKRNVLPHINELVRQRDALEQELELQAKKIVMHLLSVFAACDIATITVDNFEESIDVDDRIEADTSFYELVKKQANEWNKIVQIIDGGRSESMSMLYADMAEEIADEVIPIIHKIIKKYQNSEKGKQLF